MSPAEDDPAPEAAIPPSGGVWALPVLALGLGLIACALIIPAADENRHWAFERERLRAELAALQEQRQVNSEFLNRVQIDAELAGRLMGRQTRRLPDGAAVLGPDLRTVDPFAMSPFALIATGPAMVPLEPTPPVGGRFSEWCRDPRARLGVLGTGLFTTMVGLLGGPSKPRRHE